ncbi:MAG: hypothetical protein ACLUAO_04120 [Streptococcus sp.]
MSRNIDIISCVDIRHSWLSVLVEQFRPLTPDSINKAVAMASVHTIRALLLVNPVFAID